MARRKKEPEGFHKQQIIQAAEHLFTKNGIANTTMDQISRTANYSKATIYVYFKCKEEIVGELILNSMKQLYERICTALSASTDTKKKYDLLCNQLVEYEAEFPFYFEIALGKINTDFDSPASLNVDKKTFQVGELINEKIAEMISLGIKNGSLRGDINIPEVTMVFWSCIAGIVMLASNKKDYIENFMGISKEAFLSNGFNTLYRSIAMI